ncbi:MAG: DUF72 domain-containing protein [Candidatus Aenigmarchaeota archaeon]|nr:DUF72 domain-containing protein [Candidatus Aenigmarchaeota archaeon]MDW8148980.1 DUF72 domain-containing protein [Candidatus Aenigmarchaeota archaeon]
MIKIGCCGFPVNKKKYFENLLLVELQSIFYNIPTKIETVEKWRKEAPKKFEFSLKASQVITHEISSSTYKRMKNKFGNTKNYGHFKNTREVFEAWEKTKKVAKILKSKIVVFQCPPSFKESSKNIENIKNFFNSIESKNFTFAVELRSEWKEKTVEKICSELNLVHCIDPFKQKPVYGNLNYFRLHGKNGYNLKYNYIESDLKELLNFCDKGENYVLFNNLNMFSNALHFKSLLKNEKRS